MDDRAVPCAAASSLFPCHKVGALLRPVPCFDFLLFSPPLFIGFDCACLFVSGPKWVRIFSTVLKNLNLEPLLSMFGSGSINHGSLSR
jgi:hypothetical protein